MWWSPKTFEGETTGEGFVLGLALSEIQLYCPFVVFRPTVLPSGFKPDAISYRPEVPPEPLSEIEAGEETLPEMEANTSVRMSAKSGTGELSIKQFLYDWLPPAYDHPSLWRSDRRPIAHEVSGAIGWVASNFREQHAGSIMLDRTMIEITDIGGTLSDSEIVDVMNGLEPVDREAREAILKTPLGHLCYDRRYPTAIPQVPLGYWQYIHQTGVSRDIRVGEEIAESDLLSGDMLSPYRESGLHTVIFYKAGDRTVGVEEIIEEPGNLNATIRLLATRRRETAGELAEHCIIYPPKPDDQDCDRETLSIEGLSVHYAYADARYGSHEAVFASADHAYMILVKPRPETDREWFLETLTGLIERVP